MVGSDDVEAVVEQGLPECVTVVRGLYRRVALDLIAQPFVIVRREMEVMHAHFGRNSLLRSGASLRK